AQRRGAHRRGCPRHRRPGRGADRGGHRGGAGRFAGGAVNAVRAVVDIDDTQGLIAADRDGLLRAAAMAGAQVRATAAAVDEGALESIRAEARPRSVVWVAGRGTAESAGAVLAAALGGSAVEPIVLAAEVPPWV